MKLSHNMRRRIVYGAALASVAATVWWTWPEPSGSQPAAPAQSQKTAAPDADKDEREPTGSPALSVTVDGAEYAPNPAPMAEMSPPEEPSAVEPVPKVQIYTVVEGDTVEAIAARYGLDPTSVLWSNGLDEYSLLQVGQELLIPAIDGVIHATAEGDTLWDIAAAYGVAVEEIVRANPDISPDFLSPGDQLVIPGGRPPRRSTMVASRSGSESERGLVEPEPEAEPAPEPPPEPGPQPAGLLWPLSGQLTEYFGWRTHPVYGTSNFHEGIDIAVPPGTPIRAVAGGVVTMAEWYGGWGLTVQVDHGNGLVSRYSHDSELLVRVGDWVEAGQIIAYSGNTGVSTGPHLDFGLYLDGAPVDPLDWLP